MYKQTAQDLSAVREFSRVNTHGDVYRKNDWGQIISFKFAHSDILFTFGYDADGFIADIESSTGWRWTKLYKPGSDGWLVRNYFERWYVGQEDCKGVYVTEFGVKAVGNHPEKMHLPERP